MIMMALLLPLLLSPVVATLLNELLFRTQIFTTIKKPTTDQY